MLQHGMPDEPCYEQGRQRVEQRVSQPDADERAQHGTRRQHIASRVLGVGQQHLARQPPACALLVLDDEHVDDERHRSSARCPRGTPAALPLHQPNRRGSQHLHQHDDEEQHDRDRGHRFVLPMAVRMVVIGRAPRHRYADQRHDVRRGIGQRMEAIRDDRNGAGGVAEDDLGNRDQRG